MKFRTYEHYKKIGWDALPIPPVTQDNQSVPTKGPQYAEWQKRAASGDFTSSDFEYDHTNIGVLLGGSKNLTDVDCDDPLTPAIAAEVIEESLKTATCVFGRKSKPDSHFFFYADESLPSEKIVDPTNKACVIEYRCVKGDGSRGLQTVVPGSVHPSGERINFTSGHEPNRTATVSAKHLRKAVRLTAAIVLMAKYFPEAEKHYTKRAWARVLHDGGIKKENAVWIITTAYKYAPNRHEARNHSKDVRDVEEVYKLLGGESKDANLYGWAKLVDAYDTKVLDKILTLIGAKRPQKTSQYPSNDIGNALRFVDTHKDKARYCPEDKAWYIWNGSYWEHDERNHVQELCKGVAADMLKAAEESKPPANASEDETTEFLKAKEARLKWVNRTSMIDRLSAMAKVASSLPEIIVTKKDLDTHDNLLNCTNGVVNLHTGELMPHDRKLFITQSCPTEYTKGFNHPDWTNVLAAVTRKHHDLADFLQTLTGYIAQGNKGEELIVLCHGPGGTGKGTFWNTIQQTLGGDFVCNVSSSSLLRQDRNGGNASGDIARLEGSRLAIASEFERGSKLQDSFLKLVSGNNKITARRLYQEEREFRPTFQLVFQSNHRPQFNGVDTGNKRRYIEIPFDNVIAEDPLVTVDAGLKKRLAEDKDVHKAVLAWIVAGCVEYKAHGLPRPACVQAATEELFRDNDVLDEFFTDCLVREIGSKVPVAQMRVMYEFYCKANHSEPFSSQTFNRMLKERGLKYEQKSVNGKVMKVWSGVKMSATGEGILRSPEDTVRNMHSQYRAKKSATAESGFDIDIDAENAA